jgi:hypothetical protein
MLERNNVRLLGEMKELLDSFSREQRQQILAVLKQVFSELDSAAEPKVAAQGAK